MTFEQWWNSDPTRAGMTESHPAKMGARDGWNAVQKDIDVQLAADREMCAKYVEATWAPAVLGPGKWAIADGIRALGPSDALDRVLTEARLNEAKEWWNKTINSCQCWKCQRVAALEVKLTGVHDETQK